ncbi:hypothetical protein NQ318_013671 [Aromia moschata]|uniref:HTH CENPB-type domain-containing protein n=1 Tax=Aromia moschata TaxID=1265417 RepID=A0AAV8XYQ4_9CUCU|nr:hypothetical protein NQ318_013671 [Aromia moschata]
MPREHKRKLGARSYKNYTPETLEAALAEVKTKKLSLRKAAEKYQIHYNTRWLKLKGKHTRPHGKPRVFTDEEENAFTAHVIAMSSFGFPVTAWDLRLIVKSYLDRQGRTVRAFQANPPGKDWLTSFLRRHHELTQRIAQNISHARAATDEETVNNFFNNLEEELRDIPPSNIWNYDETNLVDDPGKPKIITKRGTKSPERIRNASKACTSIMDGPKAVIGDNLSSHLNVHVIQECQSNNIKFIALPPNSTHLLQALDIAYFRSMKENWRKTLSDWKSTSHGSRLSTVPKDEFPKLLKQLMKKLEARSPENLKSGFRKAGIYPLNRDVVLARLCTRSLEGNAAIKDALGDSFIQHLNKTRTESVSTRTIRRKKRLNVPPGRSITAADLQDPENDAHDPAVPSCSTDHRITRKNADSSSDEDSVEYQESGERPEEFSSDEVDQYQEQIRGSSFSEKDKSVGNFVLVKYEGKMYPGKIISTTNEGAIINAMTPFGKQWKWPLNRDEIFYRNEEIVMKIEAPRKQGRREIFDVPELT